MRHAARRLSLSGTAPPFRGRRVTATPYALVHFFFTLEDGDDEGERRNHGTAGLCARLEPQARYAAYYMAPGC